MPPPFADDKLYGVNPDLSMKSKHCNRHKFMHRGSSEGEHPLIFRLARRKTNQIRFFRGHAPRKKLFSALKCASDVKRSSCRSVSALGRKLHSAPSVFLLTTKPVCFAVRKERSRVQSFSSGKNTYIGLCEMRVLQKRRTHSRMCGIKE